MKKNHSKNLISAFRAAGIDPEIFVTELDNLIKKGEKSPISENDFNGKLFKIYADRLRLLLAS
jgi:hypothetical protein